MSHFKFSFLKQPRFQKIRSRFLAAIILLSVPPLVLLGYISFNIAKGTIMEMNTQTSQGQLRTSSEVADLTFRSAVNLHRSIILNERIRDGLRLAAAGGVQDEQVLKNEIVNELQKISNNNFINSRFVDSVCVVDFTFNAYCLGRSDHAGQYEGHDKERLIKAAPWYRQTIEGQGRVLFFSDNVWGDSNRTFSTAKLFRDSGTAEGEAIGLLIINISKTIFDSFFTGNAPYPGEFMVLHRTENGVQPVHSPRSEALRELLAGADMNEALSGIESHGYLAVDYENMTTGWRFVYAVELSQLLKQSNRIGAVTAWIGAFIALVAIILSYIVSGTITKPLLQVKKMMVEWFQGRRPFDATFEQDEVGAIGETFKRMTAENRELNERLVHTELREREAELRALQAQIKPHFLYNTLDSIYWMAKLQKHQEAAQMAMSLSESFKLSLNKGKETIILNKELEHIRHYLTIQNIRYNNRFLYVENLDPAMKGMEVLKLLLQPLVENAIYHGLEPKVGEGTVRLTGMREGEALVFIVEDDGVGVADMARIEQGYGLNNVKERIRMYYGEASALTLSSEPGAGTRVELRLYPKDAARRQEG